MIEINSETVYLSSAIMSLLSLLTMLFINKKYSKEFKTLSYFVLFYFFQTIGLTLLLFKSFFPTFLIATANIFFVLASMLLLRGFLILYSKKILRKYGVIAIVLYTIIFATIYYLLSFSIIAQTVFYLITSIVIFFIATILIYRANRVKDIKYDFTLPICIYFFAYYIIQFFMTFIANEAFLNAFNNIMVFINAILRAMLIPGVLILVNNEFKSTLGEVENKYLHIFSDIRDALILVDKQTRMIIESNEAAQSLYGYNKDEILYLTDVDLSAEPEKTKAGISNVPSNVVRKHKKKDGTVFTAEITTTALKINGRDAILDSVRDVSEREALQKKIAFEHKRAIEYFEIANVIFLVIDKNGKVQDINRKGCQILECSEKNIVGKNWFDNFLPQANANEVKSIFNKVVKNEKENIEFFENSIITATGKERFIAWHNSILKDEDGNLSGILSTGSDITDRKNAESALIESEEKFRYIFDNSSISKSLTTLSGEVHVNKAFCKMLGYLKEEIEGEKWQRISHPDDSESILNELNLLISGQKDKSSFTKRYIKKDGSIIWAEIHTSIRRDSEGKPLYFLTSAIDITDRKKAEEELKKSEERYQILFTEMSTAFALHEIICDDEGKPANYRFLAINPAFEQMTGLKADDIVNKTVLEVLPSTESYWIEAYGEVALTGKPMKINQYTEALNKYFDVTAYRPAPNQFACTFMDVTKEKIAQKKLIDSETKHKAMIASISDVIGILGADGKLKYNSENITRFFGWSSDDLIGKDSLDMVHPDDREKIRSELQETLSNPKILKEIEFRLLCKDKSFKYVRLSSRNMIDDSIINGILVNFEDITEKKKLENDKKQYEAQLRNQQKLESIGTLASGIAHEINNPINGVINYSQLIIDADNIDNESRKYAEEILNESNRVSSIVKNLLQFSRQEDKHSSKARVEDIINRTVSLIRTLIKKDQIQIIVNIEEYLPEINCRSQEIQQVLMNLMTNARDALNEKYDGYDENKKLIISARKKIWKNKEVVCIVVKDHGTGVPKEIQGKILDPFFTTKSRDKGTGLGLSISYGIVKEHGGELIFDTKEGKYTKWTVILQVDE